MVDWTPLRALAGQLGSKAQYIGVHRVFSLVSLVGPVTHFVNAPFGRFSLSKSRLNVNGNIGWFIMELVSPVTFSLSLLGSLLDTSPLSIASSLSLGQDAWTKAASFTTPTKILAVLYLVHYINRSTISSLRTPQKRSPMHITVPLSAVAFNLANGYLMGAWLGGRTSSLTAKIGAVPEVALHSKLFWFGVTLWTLGFLGNLVSDEILYDLRRPSKDDKGQEKPAPRYSIPRGFLYDRPIGGISFPAYFCEWFEWLGFAIAATCLSPAPALPAASTGHAATAIVSEGAGKIVESASAVLLPAARNKLLESATYLTPPFLFLYAEIATMLPRALKGHAWYQDKFNKEFPRDRKAIIPGLL